VSQAADAARVTAGAKLAPQGASTAPKSNASKGNVSKSNVSKSNAANSTAAHGDTAEENTPKQNSPQGQVARAGQRSAAPTLAATPTANARALAERQAGAAAVTPAAVAVRPLIPMPKLAPRPGKASSSPPSAAALALEQAGPNLPAEAFLDREPEFRPPLEPQLNPARAERPGHYRSLRASVAATAMHEQLKAKLHTDALDTPARYRETDSDREALRAVAANVAPEPADPYPLQLLRRLRRTLHLSTPLPESVRSLLAKYTRN
jgi:hypothetical protein